jgi:MFS family permease
VKRLLHTPTPFLVAFAAAALAAGLGRALTTSYLPVLLERIDDEPGLIGMVMLVNAAAGMVVPLVTGIWSDRLARRGRGRRLPFITGGALLTAGGLIAVALGASSSYLVLALAGAAVYTGLNALTTAHRALVPELFQPSGRARATSAQELAMLVGGLLGLVLGGLLTELSPWAPFVVAAVLVPALSIPTLRRTREPEAAELPETAREHRPVGYYLHAAARPGVRGFLLAQILWVLGYAALPAFFLLYAKEELGLRPSVASLLLAGFGIATGAAILAAGRVRRTELHRSLLLVGVVLMGVGFLGVAATTSLVTIGPALLAAAVGFGLVSVIGFPLFSNLIPKGEEGGYTALYFSVRSISSTIALPAAGWTVDVTGSYRAIFMLGGAAGLAAIVPLVGVPQLTRPRVAAALLAVVPVLGLVVAQTGAHRLDEDLFRAVNGIGPGPHWLWTLLDPHTRNYIVLIGIAVAAAFVVQRAHVLRVFSRVMLSAVVAWGLLEAIYVVYERPRPEEVVDQAEISVNGHSWAALNSFPSGHMAITAALAVATALVFPRLRTALWAYVAAVAFTRVMFGAHFPSDVIAGTALGTASALVVALAFERYGSRRAVAADEELRHVPAALERSGVVAIMPSHEDVPERALVDEVRQHVGSLVIVDDGSSPAVAEELDRIAEEAGAELVRLSERGGKGTAVRAGIDHVLSSLDGVEAVLVIDADGQHPASLIPAFIEAAGDAELVIGDRFGDLAAMPWQRRLANLTTSRLLSLATGRRVRDTQNGMRLLRGGALELLPPRGGYEAETRHLRRALRAGLAVGWVPMPAIYGTELSSFRAARDSVRVLWALGGPDGSATPSPARSPRPAESLPARPTSSAFPDTPATAPPEPQAQAAAA